jgi:hypothetical protein
MHLCFDDPQIAAELGRGRLGFGRRAGDLPLGYRNAVIGEQLLRLVLVKIHAEGVLGQTAGGGILHETRRARKACEARPGTNASIG